MCTLLPGAIETGLTPHSSEFSTVEHNSQSSGNYSRIPANTSDNFNLLF